MKTKIQKWGNSLAVRLPKSITDQKALKAGVGVRVELQDGRIVIETVETEMDLASLLSKVSAENLHTETNWSRARGNEVW